MTPAKRPARETYSSGWRPTSNSSPNAATSHTWVRIALTLTAAMSQACDDPRQTPAGVRTEAVLAGEASDTLSGMAFVAHADVAQLCSGVLIAPQLVLTAAHCAVRSVLEGDEALPAGRFDVGFGPDQSRMARRAVSHVEWLGAASGTALDELVARGQDIAVLRLAEPAPSTETVRDVDLAFQPTNEQSVTIAGFGVTDIDLTAYGARNHGTARITGFDPGTGVIQVAGAAACLGDSGGPVLTADRNVVVAIISEVGQIRQPCDAGLTFGVSAANPSVRDLIARECTMAGGCGARTARGSQIDSDAGTATPTDDDAGVSTVPSENDADSDPGCGSEI
jgi:secreted trypsin-like serine protease